MKEPVYTLQYVNSKGKVELEGEGARSIMKQKMDDVKEIPPGCKLVLRNEKGEIVKVYDR
jgi:hypothetical protein